MKIYSKNWINKIYRFIISSDFLFFFISISLFILFKRLIENIISNSLVEYLFSFIEKSYPVDLIFIILVLIGIITMIYDFKRFKPSKNFSKILILISLIYLSFYRFKVDSVWRFEEFFLNDNFYYLDVILLLTLFRLVLHTSKLAVINPLNSKDAFFNEESLGENGEDEFGYSNYVSQLSKKILESNFDNSFAIGLNASWGMGKTSFIDLLQKKLKNDDVITIEFNVWASKNSNSIVQNFFKILDENLRVYSLSLSRLIRRYSKEVQNLNSNLAIKLIHEFLIYFFKPLSTDTLYSEINTTLSAIDKKLIIFIDDVDRLSTSEIIEVLKLIRNTANFRNTFFLVAYDRNYVVSAIKSHNCFNERKYLEKIFQLEISLPLIPKNVLEQQFYINVKEVFPDIIEKEQFFYFKGYKYDNKIRKILNDWLKSKRDVTRLSNSFCLNFGKLIGNVDLYDFFSIEVLRVFYPDVYDLIKDKPLEFFETQSSGNDFTYKLKKENNVDSLPLKITLYRYLEENSLKYFLSSNEIEKISSHLDENLFCRSFSSDKLSIVYPSMFDIYFSYMIPISKIPRIQFSKARRSSFNDFKNSIDKWISDGLELEIARELEIIRQYDNRDDYEKVISSIFYLVNQKSNLLKYRVNVRYDDTNLINKLNNYENCIVNKYYSKEKEPFYEFLIKQFQNANPPYYFESGVLRRLNEFNSNVVLNSCDRKRIMLNYLTKYTEQIESIDDEVYRLFYCCFDVNDRHKIYWTEAIEIMLEFVKKDYDQFLLSLIKKDYRSDKYYIFEVVDILFSGKHLFKPFLISLMRFDLKYLHEFKKFHRNFEKISYSTPVNFHFEIIPIGSN
ncbi:MAG: AAA family ATPase [Flavobacteriales bacterium]|nr:AAA family ATPase [Flavobacteriales bacterium]